MENIAEGLSLLGIGIGVIGLVIYAISGLFRHKGIYYKGTGKPTGSYEINGKFNEYGRFEGNISQKYNNGGYIEGSKNLAGKILSGIGIGIGMMIWSAAWWGLQFLSCLSCFFTADINAMSKNDNIVGISAFLIGIVAGIIGGINAE